LMRRNIIITAFLLRKREVSWNLAALPLSLSLFLS